MKIVISAFSQNKKSRFRVQDKKGSGVEKMTKKKKRSADMCRALWRRVRTIMSSSLHDRHIADATIEAMAGEKRKT